MEKSLNNCEHTNVRAKVSAVAFERSEDVDAGLCYIVSMLFTHIKEVLQSEYLYKAADSGLPRKKETEQYVYPPTSEQCLMYSGNCPKRCARTLK